MKAIKKRCDNATIEHSTWSAKIRIDRTIGMAEKYKTDPDKKERLEYNLCPVHYYNEDRVGGAVITKIECAICGKELSFSNTCVDMLCDKCASELNLCKHCGGDIDAKKRRKQRF